MSYTLATMFSGGGLFDLGARAAGLTPIWAVERDPAIAAVYRANLGNHCITADVRGMDYTLLPVPDWLHASPSCTNASRARGTGGGETEGDRQAANAICQALERLPRIFSLENVWWYRTFEAFQTITQQLERLGYARDFWHLNAADYGVPQTRKRLVLVARRDGQQPRRPEPTHSKQEKQGDMFTSPWVGWYESIEDLLPTLPESELAPWQVRRLRECADTSFLVSGTPSSDGKGFRSEEEPSYTVMASPFAPIRAVLCSTNRDDDQPYENRLRQDTNPAFTVTANNKSLVRAVFFVEPQAILVDGYNGSQNSAYTYIPRAANEPASTVTASIGRVATRVLMEGRCVQLTPRALARLQSIPDGYVLPANRRLAGQIIGNAVPPLLAQRLVEANI